MNFINWTLNAIRRATCFHRKSMKHQGNGRIWTTCSKCGKESPGIIVHSPK